MKEMFSVQGRELCADCANAEVDRLTKPDIPYQGGKKTGRKKLPVGTVVRLVDPTVCVKCGKDNGQFPFALLNSGVPVCPDCDAKVRNPRLPFWIKAWFVVLVGLAAASCFYNLRFFRAYDAFKRGTALFGAQDYAAAAPLLEKASKEVPEERDMKALASAARGIDLLSRDKSAEALPFLQEAAAIWPDDESLKTIALNAEASAAFEAGDYVTFLDKTRAIQEANPEDSTAVAQVASALACRYAVTGEAAYREEALVLLAKAESLAGPDDPAYLEYEGRILYRLDSRKIIEKAEYDAMFPEGYKRNGGSQ